MGTSTIFCLNWRNKMVILGLSVSMIGVDKRLLVVGCRIWDSRGILSPGPKVGWRLTTFNVGRIDVSLMGVW